MYPLTEYEKMPVDEQEFYSPVREAIEGLIRYVNDKIPTGDFLYAVLCNDLTQSFARADWMNTRHMSKIVTYVYTYVPMVAKGNKEKVDEWLKSRFTDSRSGISE